MPTSLEYYQDSFDGGMNLLSQDTKVGANEYRLGINVRSRFGPLAPIKAPVESMTGIVGAITRNQGFYTFGVIQVLFADGGAYYRILGSTDWAAIAGFAMGSTEDRIYACAVPKASNKYLRKNSSGTDPKATINLTDTITGSEVALVVQDGVKQPWLIFSDGTCRIAGDYASYDIAVREYVPIGKQMSYFKGILLIVSPDGKSVYHSVSGRPLDFAVAIDNNGAPVADATAVSFSVDANEIKLIDKLNTETLLIITAYAGWAVSLNFDDKIYGEPTFDQTFLFTAGAINQFSGIDALGDYVFIDREGLKSFNAVSQIRNEGNNSVFSLGVAELFNGIRQGDCCVGGFDNYLFFSVQTTFSVASVLVFDTLKKVFVSVDVYGIDVIRQFATSYSDTQQRFFAVTAHKVYELFPSTGEDYNTATVFPRALNSKNSDLGSTDKIENLKFENIKVIFERGVDAGNLRLTNFVNDKVSERVSKAIAAREILGFYLPLELPVIAKVRNNNYPIDIPVKSLEGQKLHSILTWTGGAQISQLQFTTSCSQAPNTKQQQARV